jgi:hypothetical protein
MAMSSTVLREVFELSLVRGNLGSNVKSNLLNGRLKGVLRLAGFTLRTLFSVVDIATPAEALPPTNSSPDEK